LHLINVTFLPSKVAGSSRPWYPITLVLILSRTTFDAGDVLVASSLDDAMS
jgi:hypothetical protein